MLTDRPREPTNDMASRLAPGDVFELDDLVTPTAGGIASRVTGAERIGQYHALRFRRG